MEWKQINSNYEVSDTGLVRSVTRRVRCTQSGIERYRVAAGKILKPWRSGSGYMMVHLGRAAVKQIHTLVLEAFVGPRPDGCEAAHLNGDKVDNRLENLSWKSRVENQADRYAHNTRGLKLRFADVRAIFVMQAAKMRQADIARVFGVSQHAVSQVLQRKTLSGWAPPPSMKTIETYQNTNETDRNTVEV